MDKEEKATTNFRCIDHYNVNGNMSFTCIYSRLSRSFTARGSVSGEPTKGIAQESLSYPKGIIKGFVTKVVTRCLRRIEKINIFLKKGKIAQR